MFSKYAWVVPLKGKRGITIVNVFQKILVRSNRKLNKTWVHQGEKFYNYLFKRFLKNDNIDMYQHTMKEHLLLLKCLLEL